MKESSISIPSEPNFTPSAGCNVSLKCFWRDEGKLRPQILFYFVLSFHFQVSGLHLIFPGTLEEAHLGGSEAKESIARIQGLERSNSNVALKIITYNNSTLAFLAPFCSSPSQPSPYPSPCASYTVPF